MDGRMKSVLFADRRDAGRKLAEALAGLRGEPLLVLGLPRGGVVVASEIALALDAPLDVVLVRKIGAPENPEYALGAVAEIGQPQINLEMVDLLGIPRSYLEAEVARQREEMCRQRDLYRGGRPPVDPAGKVCLLVDDGIATGLTVRAAVVAVRSGSPASLVLAVPVAPAAALAELAPHVDETVCLASPYPFVAVGLWYGDFGQVSDEEVRRCLERRPS